MVNGRLARTDLAPIYGGYLRKDAAAAWNAMCAEAWRRYGVRLHPLGGMSSYRTYAQQLYLWNLYRSGRGNLAAYPGTSNHGWGLAVDLASHQMRAVVDAIGAKYGWQKQWSDAQSEWWHIRYRPGVWKPGPTYPALKFGSRGIWVTRLQNRLNQLGFKVGRPRGYFGPITRQKVIAFQRRRNLRADGVVGAGTWKALLRR